MSDDWQPGDLALCVRGGRGRRSAGKVGGVWKRESGEDSLRSGMIYVVEMVRFTDGGAPYLKVRGVEGPWLGSRFRKIRPHTPDQEDVATIALMRRAPVPVEA